MKTRKPELVLLEQAGAAPAPQFAWRAFSKFVADIEELRERYDRLRKLLSDPEADDCCIEQVRDAEYYGELVARCRAGLARFNPGDLYEDDEDGERMLRTSHIAKRIGVMVASFPNANPGCPEGYLQMLIEHVADNVGVSALSLESACREIVETQKFAPAISEVLEVIERHNELWHDRRFAIRGVEDRRLAVIKQLAEREEKQKQEHRDRRTRLIEQQKELIEQQKEEIEKTEKEIEKTEGADQNELRQLFKEQLEKLELMVVRHARAERVLRKLTANDDEQAAAAKVDGERRLDG